MTDPRPHVMLGSEPGSPYITLCGLIYTQAASLGRGGRNVCSGKRGCFCVIYNEISFIFAISSLTWVALIEISGLGGGDIKLEPIIDKKQRKDQRF